MLSLQPFFVKPAAFCVLLLLERPGSVWGVLLESPSRGTRCLQTVLRAGCFLCSPGAWEIPGDIPLPEEHQDTNGLILLARLWHSPCGRQWESSGAQMQTSILAANPPARNSPAGARAMDCRRREVFPHGDFEISFPFQHSKGRMVPPLHAAISQKSSWPWLRRWTPHSTGGCEMHGQRNLNLSVAEKCEKVLTLAWQRPSLHTVFQVLFMHCFCCAVLNVCPTEMLCFSSKNLLTC